MAVPASRIDLVPPLGAGAGLPLTFVWADNFADTAGAGNANLALFDTALWTPRNQPTNGVVQAASPSLHPSSNVSQPALARFPDYQTAFLAGAVADNTPPRLNYATGSLEHAQATICQTPAFIDRTQIASFTPMVQATITNAGRHLQHPRRYYASARAGNYTWQGLRAEGDDNTFALSRMMPSIDLQIGSQKTETPSATLACGLAITHMANTDLPSNGYGRTYGDSHNSAFISSLWSCSMHSEGGTSPLLVFDNKAYSAHWGMNIQVEQTQLELGKPLSGPDGLANSIPQADHSSLALPPETVQTIIVNDEFSDKTNPTTGEMAQMLGRVDLGNHVVADTCGLVGYEGIISATAFLSVSKHSNPPQAQSPPASPLVPQRQWNENGAGMYAGINIQVHSGNTLRRNGLAMGSDLLQPSFRYGSDGTFVEPMTEGMSTTGIRTDFKGTSFTQNANMTRFHTGRIQNLTNGVNDLNQAVFNEVENSINANTLNRATSKGADRFILGDTTAAGAAWNATIQLSQTFMKDRIPTKVKVVPVLVDTVDTTVTAGASHPQSNSITFKKPIVDYHVIISLTEKTRINATVDLDSTANGTPTNRNFPQTKRLTANMDLEDEGCEIYHAIFRIDPTLERVWFTADSNALLTGLRSADANCPDSVIPRHNSTNGGWNLHQLTPFRPLANSSWAKVPLLCAAIEAGGFYQRGGISHLWDADAYGGELFVSADAIDATHFNAQTWGTGQVWADGVGDLTYPRGSELLVFKYDPSTDPYYTSTATSVMNSPLWKISQEYVTTAKAGNSQVVNLTDTLLKGFNQYDGWSIHDWVFPQIELMRYLGREDKANARHPRHSLNTNGDPIFHPTLHCSSLRFMDSGKMAMAAIHRDYIGSEEEYPASDLNYPPNPDSGSGGGCPAGYYRSGDQCVPITPDDNPAGGDSSHLDPITGEVLPTPPPTPTNGSGEGHTGGGDNFDLTPSWSRIVANTSARSLILMWSDIPADNGKAVGGRKMFDAEKIRVDGQDYYTQNWTFKDSWWSGSRISYWYSESGQRAIPITYGSYPEVRCSYAVLPKSLPHLFIGGIQHGYPTLQPLERIFGFSDAPTQSNLDTWATERADHLKMTTFVPTTIGFSDYGASANPHQEHGWSGWSFPRGLYDPIGYGDNTSFFSDSPEATGVNYGTGVTPTLQAQWASFGRTGNLMRGTQSFWSHHGPLHYGITTTNHPFKPTRTWKQVHGGVGYDIPIHLLAPAQVAVRARSGGRNSLDLEMETPFHRTDTLHLDGGIKFNTGYELGGKANPAATRTPLGQYYLRTNLWDDASRIAGNATQGLGAVGTEIGRGPLLSGNDNKLTAFWNDHPTEHFHAGAVPIMPNNDYDLAVIENERYAPAILGRIDEISDTDYVAVAEQLQSSVDVHVSSVTRPMWDSGSIVSGRGTGQRDLVKASLVSQIRSEMSGELIRPAAESKTVYHDDGFGKGQRILRTDDGTLHIFNIERSGKTSAGEVPVFTHYTKPLHNDLFWNRKAQRVNPSVSAYDGKDEVGPHIGLSEHLRSACFAPDSQGTIHAVVEIEDINAEHKLHYTYAKRKLVSYNPSPVYEWDWSVHTPVLLAGQTSYNLREPSIVCDSNDRLHLVCRMVDADSHIIYTTKLPSDSSFLSLPSYVGDPANWTINSWSKVNATVSNPVVVDDNASNLTNHKVADCDKPKVCLIGDNTPMVFYRGGAAASAGVLGDRANNAIYANVGRNETGTHDPSGRFIFDITKAIHVVGVQNPSQYPTRNVIYYDAIIDENDRAFVCIIKDDAGRSVLLNSFDASVPFADEYSSANGLGVTKALFIPKNATVRPDYKHITMTTNGMGEIHMILGFTLAGADADRVVGGLYRDGVTDATIQPLQWATTPASDANVTPPAAKGAGGGYKVTGSGDWPDGGTYLQPTTGKVTHFMEVWMPTFEFSQDGTQADEVLRSINIRWLSVPSMNYDATNGWQPVGSAQSMNGHEDFTHTNPQLRSQRFWGFDASELDLKWATNELSWMNTMHGGARLYYPYLGGSFTTVGEGDTTGSGVAGWPI